MGEPYLKEIFPFTSKFIKYVFLYKQRRDNREGKTLINKTLGDLLTMSTNFQNVSHL